MFYNPFFFNYNIPKSEIELPHVFNVIVDQEEGMHINISVMFWHWRFNREFAIDSNSTEYPTSVVIAKYDEKFNLTETCGKFNSIGNLDYNVKLSKGRYAVWVYSNYESSCDPKHSTYYIRFLSEKHFYVRKSEQLDKFFSLIKKMIIAGVNEEHQNKIKENAGKNWYYACAENGFKETGLGYFFIKKQPKASHVCVKYDATNIQGFCLLPPKKVEIDSKLYTDDEEIILSLRVKTYSSYWMNVDYNVEEFFEPESVITGMKRDITKFLSQEKVEDLKLSAKADTAASNKSIEERNKIILKKQMSIKIEIDNNPIKEEEIIVPIKVSKHEKLIKPIENLFLAPKGDVILNYSKIRLCHVPTKKYLTVLTENLNERTPRVEVSVCDIDINYHDDSLFSLINIFSGNDNKIRDGDSICLSLDKIDRYLFCDFKERSKVTKQIDVHFKKYIHDHAGFLFKIHVIYSPYGDNFLRVGSVFKLVSKKIALHSHLEYLPGTDNKHQEVTGFVGNDENDYWTIVQCL